MAGSHHQTHQTPTTDATAHRSPIRIRSRISRACDACHRRGRKCRPAHGGGHLPCLTCRDTGLTCTRNRAATKRGPKPGRRPQLQASGGTAGAQLAPRRLLQPGDSHASEPVLRFLVTSFFDNVYPIANYVHEKTFVDAWIPGDTPSHGSSSYARLMSMCALSACRVNMGSDAATSDTLYGIDPDYYLDEALGIVRSSEAMPRDIEFLQTIGLICMAALEIGNASLLHEYLGIYHTVVAEQGLWDERRWPARISDVEKEERRRLFWHMYRLEVHMSMIMGHAVRCPELQAMVHYPSMTDPDASMAHEWLSGWNFVTDLYRALEHLLTRFRIRLFPAIRDQKSRSLSTVFLVDHDLDKSILEPLYVTYRNLPDRFTAAAPMSLDKARNRCGFQAANIICTYQLVKMVSYSSDETALRPACRTAHDLIDQITSIPLEYLRAMSLAMVQELSGFGYILSNFLATDLNESDGHVLKTAMLCMAEFLESLDSNLSEAARTSQRFRAYASRIDKILEQDNVADPSMTADVSYDEWNAELALEHGIFWGDVGGLYMDIG